MKSIIGCKVRLRLSDPDAGYGSKSPPRGWPELQGEMIAVTEGLHGKMWYLIKVQNPLPAGFNPLNSSLPEKYETIPIWYLLLSPSPAMPTSEVPADFIGHCILNKQKAPVLVSVGVEPKRLPRKISRDDSHLQFPTICSGEVEVSDYGPR